MSYSEELIEVITSGDIATKDSTFYHISLDAETRTSEYLIDSIRTCISELVSRVYEDKHGINDPDLMNDTPEGRKKYLDIHEELAAAHFRSCVSEQIQEWADAA